MALVVSVSTVRPSFLFSSFFLVFRVGGQRYSYLTVGLNSEVHFTLRGVGDSVAAEFDLGAAVGVSVRLSVFSPSDYLDVCVSRNTGKTYFFIMAYLKELPNVWPSPSNWNDAAVSVAPGSCIKPGQSSP